MIIFIICWGMIGSYVFYLMYVDTFPFDQQIPNIYKRWLVLFILGPYVMTVRIIWYIWSDWVGVRLYLLLDRLEEWLSKE